MRLTSLMLIALLAGAAHARDPDGRWASSPLRPWFEALRSGKGPCCSDADGTVVQDPDWRVQDKIISLPGSKTEIRSHYAVIVDGEWRDVSDDAVITEPNRLGKTMVWPIRGALGVDIRCFMPGAEG